MQVSTRYGALVSGVLVVLTLVVVGCTPGQPTATSPEPTPGPPERLFQPVRPDHCRQLALAEIAEQFDLEWALSDDPIERYYESFRGWHINCEIGMDTDRFDTRYTWFGPDGLIFIKTFPTVAGATKEFDSIAAFHARGEDPVPELAVAPPVGWWSRSSFRQDTYDIDLYRGRGFEGWAYELSYVAQHQNLYVRVTSNAQFVPDDAAEAVPMLHELAHALLIEAARPLHLSTDPLPSPPSEASFPPGFYVGPAGGGGGPGAAVATG